MKYIANSEQYLKVPGTYYMNRHEVMHKFTPTSEITLTLFLGIKLLIFILSVQGEKFIILYVKFK